MLRNTSPSEHVGSVSRGPVLRDWRWRWRSPSARCPARAAAACGPTVSPHYQTLLALNARARLRASPSLHNAQTNRRVLTALTAAAAQRGGWVRQPRVQRASVPLPALCAGRSRLNAFQCVSAAFPGRTPWIEQTSARFGARDLGSAARTQGRRDADTQRPKRDDVPPAAPPPGSCRRVASGRLRLGGQEGPTRRDGGLGRRARRCRRRKAQ